MSTVPAVTKSLVLKRAANKNGKGIESCLRWDPHKGSAPGFSSNFHWSAVKEKRFSGLTAARKLVFRSVCRWGKFLVTNDPGQPNLKVAIPRFLRNENYLTGSNEVGILSDLERTCILWICYMVPAISRTSYRGDCKPRRQSDIK